MTLSITLMVLTCLWHVGCHMTASNSVNYIKRGGKKREGKRQSERKKRDVEGFRGDDKNIKKNKNKTPLQEQSGLIISTLHLSFCHLNKMATDCQRK